MTVMASNRNLMTVRQALSHVRDVAARQPITCSDHELNAMHCTYICTNKCLKSNNNICRCTRNARVLFCHFIQYVQSCCYLFHVFVCGDNI